MILSIILLYLYVHKLPLSAVFVYVQFLFCHIRSLSNLSVLT